MKKTLMICLLAVMSVGIMPCAKAQTASEDTVKASPSGASKDVVRVCEIFDKAIDALEKDPTKLDEIGGTLGDGVGDIDKNVPLTSADKELLRKTMYRLMKTVVLSQMETNPQLVSMLGNLPDEQKQQMIDMALQMAIKDVDASIDAAQTLKEVANNMTSDLSEE